MNLHKMLDTTRIPAKPIFVQRTYGATSSLAYAEIYVAIIILFLFVNPIIVVFICSLINLRGRISKSWIIPAFFVSLFIANRSYGVSWQAGEIFGLDDAPTYLAIYQQLRNAGLVRELFSQYEPMLLLFYKLLSLINASDYFVLFMSVMLPISITFYFITKYTRRPYLFLCIILTLFTGWWNIVFHLFRLSLGYSFIFGAIILAHKRKKGVIFNLGASFFSHLSTSFVEVSVLFYTILKKYIEKYYYLFIILTLVVPSIALYIIMVNFPEIEKVSYYSNMHYHMYFSNIWIVYICIAAFMIIAYKGDILGVISAAMIGSFTLILTGFSVIAERIILFTTSLLSIPMYFWIENKKHMRIVLVFLMLCYFIFRLIKDENSVVANSVFFYMSNGGYYNLFSGGLHNLKGLMNII